MSVARAARASRSDEKLICLGDIEVALGPDAPPIGLGWISSGRKASRDLGGLGVGKLFATAYLEATLTWRLLLRRATGTAFDDTGGQIARETPLGLRPWGSSVLADLLMEARPHVRRHHGTGIISIDDDDVPTNDWTADSPGRFASHPTTPTYIQYRAVVAVAVVNPSSHAMAIASHVMSAMVHGDQSHVD